MRVVGCNSMQVFCSGCPQIPAASRLCCTSSCNNSVGALGRRRVQRGCYASAARLRAAVFFASPWPDGAAIADESMRATRKPEALATNVRASTCTTARMQTVWNLFFLGALSACCSPLLDVTGALIECFSRPINCSRSLFRGRSEVALHPAISLVMIAKAEGVDSLVRPKPFGLSCWRVSEPEG
jgi:hypothetical protein